MLTPGTLLGERYEIIEKIGAGGMSIVYKAKDNRLQRYVAIKELREEFVQDEEFVTKFRKEALSAASLSHPNIVGIYDVGNDHEIHYIVMEYVEGRTLKQLIAEQGPFDAKTVLELGMQIVAALKHAHSKKIIHRDIKPQNILMTNDGTLKVTDFGIAKAVDSSTIVATGNAIGSVHYFSPEQAKGKYVNESSDLYSCGIVLFELATKKLPFEADSHISIALKHINEELPKPSSINPNIPENLENLILKATSKNQVDRYQNADEMLRDMKGILQNPEYVVKNNKLVERTILLSAEETKKLRESALHNYHGTSETEQVEGQEEVSIYDEGSNFEDKDLEDSEEEVPLFYKFLFGAAGVLATLAIVVAIPLICVFWVPGLFNHTYSVPNVINHTLSEAQEMLTENHLKYTVVQKVDNEVEEGWVIDQNPKAGTTLKKNGVVALTVAISLEEDIPPKEIEKEVPRLISMDTSRAQQLISDLELAIGEISFEYDDHAESGVVINQNPKPGEKVVTGSKVDLVISKGPEKIGVKVPALVGMNLEEAKNLIMSRGLRVGEIKEEYSHKYKEGTIIRQGIAAEREVEEGKSIDLIISKGPEEEEEPHPTPEEPLPSEEAPTPEPTEAPDENPEDKVEQTTTVSQSIALPVGTEVKESYHVVAKLTLDNGQSQIICDQTVAYENFPFNVDLTGSGTGVLNVSIDGQSYQENILF